MAESSANRNANNGGKRKRSFGGCATCRSRRVKCDEARPTCAVCRTAGLICGRYDTGLFFGSDDRSGTKNATPFRRPLLTIEQRTCMSNELTSLVPPHLVLWNLAQIDQHCEDAPAAEDCNISRGPFGVFKATSGQRDDATELPASSSSREPKLSNSSCDLLGVTPSCTPVTQELMELFLNEGNILQDWCTTELMTPVALVEEAHNIDTDVYHLQELSFGNDMLYEGQHMHSNALEWLPNCNSPPRPVSLSLTKVQTEIMQNDWILLLKHYSDAILQSFSPFNHKKTPWHSLFLPLTKTTFAGVALGEVIDSASLGILYGTLAISALGLDGKSPFNGWADRSRLYRLQAREHVQKSLEKCYETPKPTKYKTQLVALLTMIQLSIVYVDRDETEYFLLEGEKYIRLRGLKRKKSRKVRLLHHCYAYERIFFEATAISRPRSHHIRLNVRHAIESSSERMYSYDNLSFRQPVWKDLETDLLKTKTQEQGENDLHLQLPGLWPSSLYGEVFGVPEIYVFLVSLVIRLAREKEYDEDEPASDSFSVATFSKAAKSIERCIKQQRCPVADPRNSITFLVQAIHHSVTIYFYRKVYDLDSSMLQKQVSGIRECLSHYETADDPNSQDASMRLIWPACVAACEAEGADREFFVDWFGRRARQSGLHIFATSLANVEQLWQAKGANDTLDAARHIIV